MHRFEMEEAKPVSCESYYKCVFAGLIKLCAFGILSCLPKDSYSSTMFHVLAKLRNELREVD